MARLGEAGRELDQLISPPRRKEYRVANTPISARSTQNLIQFHISITALAEIQLNIRDI
jgi:hypothetical protein